MVVRFSAKELFAQVNTKLDTLLDKVDAKADHEALVRAVDRIEVLEDKSRETEAIANALLNEKKSRWTRNEKIAGLAYITFQTVIGIAALGPDLIHRWTG